MMIIVYFSSMGPPRKNRILDNTSHRGKIHLLSAEALPGTQAGIIVRAVLRR